MKKQRKYNCGLAIPLPIYKRLSLALNFALVDVKSKTKKESFENTFWAISCYLIDKCCYENENLDFFVNIHNKEFAEMTGQNDSTIKKIKDWLFICEIFECNFSYSNLGPNKFSYGYRISQHLQDFFSNKSSSSLEKILVQFKINEVFLNYEFNLDLDLIRIIERMKGMNPCDSIYIKWYNDSTKPIDGEGFGDSRYDDRTEMNEYEKTLAERMKKITVDLKLLNSYQGNDFKKLYWLGRILKAKKNEEVKFSHGRLYRNPFWHCLPKEFRHCCLYENKFNILEGFDVKNCFATLLLKVIEGKVSKNEYEKYKRIVRTGIYEDIAEMTTKYDRNDMKQPFCHWLFSNNKTKKLPINERFTIVRNYFKNEFPEIFELVTNYEEIEVEEKGKKIKKSKLSVDCQWIENELVLNTLCKWTEEKFNVEVWTLHDAICCKDEDFIKVNWSEVKEYWYNIMNLR